MKPLRRILHWMKPYWLLCSERCFCRGQRGANAVGAGVLHRQGVDAIIGPGQVDFSRLGRIVLLLAALFLFSSLCQYAMTLCTNHVTYHTVHDLRTAVFNRLEHVPLTTIDTHAHGDLSRALSAILNRFPMAFCRAFLSFSPGLSPLARSGSCSASTFPSR